MRKLFIILLLGIVVAGAAGGCKHSGSREFIPGKGWVPN